MNLIFDIDGTLWDIREDVAKHTGEFMARAGVAVPQLDADYFTPLFGKTTPEIADVLLKSVPGP